MTLVLNTRYILQETPENCRFDFALTNAGPEPACGFSLCYTALTRASRSARVENASLVRRIANFHEIAPPDNLTLAPGATWEFSLTGLTHFPKHRLDGPKSAYLQLADTVLPVTCTDLAAPSETDSGELRSVPQGRTEKPFYAVPWPQQASIESYRGGPALFLISEGASADNKAAAARIGALGHRLFPDKAHPFRFARETGVTEVDFRPSDSYSGDAYAVDFQNGTATLQFGTATGRDYALTLLAQIAYGANADPARYQVPAKGRITDSPRFDYRGSHLDVSRHFWPKADVLRFLDMLAWARMNVFQWHLTDDEGWRLEIKALPELTGKGAERGPGSAQVSQLGHAAETYGGYYTQDDVREIVAHASALNITVVPEIDIPGHCTAVLTAYPHLQDPDEPAESYFSVQGYPNNALNPAVPQTYDFIETVLDEVTGLFPGDYVHVGGDEVDAKAWTTSPLAQELMARENLSGTMELQAHFMRKVQALLRRRGRKLAGWDEVSQGGGIDPEGVLLVAWQKPELTRELIELGYEVVCSPGQAYYMDMVQASGWQEPGASWAGISSPEHCYGFEPDAGLADGKAVALKGVQACIWCEHLINKELFNHMVFPRLYAVAEAGWTDPQGKNWHRFAAQSRLFPKL